MTTRKISDPAPAYDFDDRLQIRMEQGLAAEQADRADVVVLGKQRKIGLQHRRVEHEARENGA